MNKNPQLVNLRYNMLAVGQFAVSTSNTMDRLLHLSFTSIIPGPLKLIVTVKSGLNLAVLANSL